MEPEPKSCRKCFLFVRAKGELVEGAGAFGRVLEMRYDDTTGLGMSNWPRMSEDG